jgi:hypothetical protein
LPKKIKKKFHTTIVGLVKRSFLLILFSESLTFHFWGRLSGTDKFQFVLHWVENIHGAFFGVSFLKKKYPKNE